MQSTKFHEGSAPLALTLSKSECCLFSEDCDQTIHLNFRLCVHCERSVRKLLWSSEKVFHKITVMILRLCEICYQLSRLKLSLYSSSVPLSKLPQN